MRTLRILTPDRRVIRAPFAGRRSLQRAVDALTAINREYLWERPETPGIYESGVRYQREPRTISGARREDWLSIPHVLARGVFDCEDGAAMRAAELQSEGINARAVVMRAPGGYHVVVRYPSGRVEDPSARLGMEF